MLKRTVTYIDFDDNKITEDLYFNLGKTELSEMTDLMPRLEAWQKRTTGPDRPLSNIEAIEFFDIIKYLVEKSYGVRTDDGRRFRKTPELFQEFKETNAYDAFLFSLMENDGQDAVQFMLGIMPKDIAAQVQAEMQPDDQQMVELPQPIEDPSFGDYTDEDLLAMSDEVFNRLAGTDANKMNQRTLRIAFLRKSR